MNFVNLFLFYTDPGSGMMLLQMLLATVAGVSYYFRTAFFRLLGRKSGLSNDVIQGKIDSEEID